MKKLMVLISMVLMMVLMSFTNVSDPYCTGWSDGYAAGYCYNRPVCASPPAPLCPGLYLAMEKDAYREGYGAGFVRGIKDHR